MDKAVQELITNDYGLNIKNITPGPRQFIAETYILTLENGVRYFVKQIKQNHYTDLTIQSLPILDQLHQRGVNYINYPIKTKSGELYIQYQNLLIIVFNFIEGEQKFGYSHSEYAELIGKIHKKSTEISTTVPKEEFTIPYQEDFHRLVSEALITNNTDPTAKQLKKIIAQYSEEIHTDWIDFLSVIKDCKNSEFDLVITHGDAPGNIIIAPNKDLYLIDWDTILLAPAERDTWFLAKSSDFLNAYRAEFPEYTVNKSAYKFYLYNRYFDDMQGFIAEILSDKSNDHKEKNLYDLKKDCFDEWLRPLIRSLNS